jgi:hypothetical protein
VNPADKAQGEEAFKPALLMSGGPFGHRPFLQKANRFSGPWMGHGSSASHFEAGRFKHPDQFIDVAPKETFEEAWVHALIAALHCFHNKQSLRFQDFQDLSRDAIDVEGVIERIRVDDVH